MHTVWKSWGRVHEVFAKFWEGGHIGVVKILRGGYTFIPTHPLTPLLCASMIKTYPEKGFSLTLGVSTVETNQDRDRDCPSCRDQFLKPVEIFSTVEIDFYFISVEIFKIETFSSRLRCVKIFIKIVETNRDFQDYSRQIKIFWDICR
jgi:hypothetical protein